MLKSYHVRIAIISWRNTWERAQKILHAEFLRSSDCTIYAAESYMPYSYNKACQERWIYMLTRLHDGLLHNLDRIQEHSPSANLLVSSDTIDSFQTLYFPTWMNPRQLTQGDISVCSKHFRAISDFLLSPCDYLLVLEDDAIIVSSPLEFIDELLQHTHFDYLDLAGGDGIECNQSNILTYGSVLVEHISYRSTRTACSYVLSKRSALAAMQSMQPLTMPIDWSIAFALATMPTDTLVFWAQNQPIIHGSSSGYYKSWRHS